MPLPSCIVGLDCSLTNTGLAAIRYEENKWVNAGTHSTGIRTKKIPDPLRQIIILANVRGFIKMHNPDVVVIEDYAFGKHSGKINTRAELVGMIKHLVLVEFGLPVYLVSPTALKKFMDCADKTKRGDKDAMFDAAYRKFRFVSVDNDIVDAYCIARYLAANKEGRQLTLVYLEPLPQYRVIPVQVPAPKRLPVNDKNRLLTNGLGEPNVRTFRRVSNPLKQ